MSASCSAARSLSASGEFAAVTVKGAVGEVDSLGVEPCVMTAATTPKKTAIPATISHSGLCDPSVLSSPRSPRSCESGAPLRRDLRASAVTVVRAAFRAAGRSRVGTEFIASILHRVVLSTRCRDGVTSGFPCACRSVSVVMDPALWSWLRAPFFLTEGPQ